MFNERSKVKLRNDTFKGQRLCSSNEIGFIRSLELSFVLNMKTYVGLNDMEALWINDDF